MKTKLFALLFVLCFAVGWLPLSAHAEEIQEYSHEAVPEYPVEIRFVPIPDVLSIWLTCQVEDGDCFYDWYEDLPEPERDGYTFLNWSASPVDNRPFDPYLPITGYYPRPLYLYGFWEESAPSYDVTFVVDGDTYYETVAEDGILSDWPDAPEKDGAFFKQWQTEDGALPGETIDSDITFYACWYDSVITYDPNGNLENGAFPSEQYPADNGEPTPEYSRELETDTHSFLGWEPEFSQIVTGSVTYTAIWEEKPTKSFTLTYDANADQDPTVAGMPSENPEIHRTYNMELDAYAFQIDPVLTRIGFSFCGWNTEADGSGTSLEPGACFSVESEATLYAIWERETCQVTFAGGEPIDCPWGGCLPSDCFPTPEAMGLDSSGCAMIDGVRYRFDGWNTQADGLGEPFTDTSPIEGSLTLHPRWVQQVEVTFQIINGTWVETGSDTYVLIFDIHASLAEKLPTAVPGEKAKDTGVWDLDPARAEALPGSRFTFTCDARASYTLTFTDGEDVTTRETLEGYPIGALPVPIKDGWTFLGWYAGEIPITAETIAEGDLALEAKWEQIYSLSFDPNGGEEPPETITGPGPHRIPAITPIRLGYLFLGWSLRPDSEMVQFETDDFYIPVGQDILYAVWQPEEYEIRYNDGVKTSIIFPDQVFTAAYGDDTPAFEGKPTRKNYTFRGWKPAVADTVTGTALYEAQWAKADKTNPKTGDESGVCLLAAVMLLSVSLCGLCFFEKSKKF